MYDDSEDDSELDEEFEYQASFSGFCTCDHDSDEHGWGSCNQDDCECEAGWEE